MVAAIGSAASTHAVALMNTVSAKNISFDRKPLRSGTPAIEAAAKTFEEETGGKIELVQKNFEDIRTDFINQVPTGNGPDITVGAHDFLGSFVEAGVIDTVDLGDAASLLRAIRLLAEGAPAAG